MDSKEDEMQNSLLKLTIGLFLFFFVLFSSFRRNFDSIRS